MNYILSFEDGTSAYLSHYGTKGMKWGVHNEETKKKYGEVGSGNFQGGGGGMLDDEDDEKKNFDARDYGYEDNSVQSRKAARGEVFGPLAAKGKMSQEKALELASKHDADRRANKNFGSKKEDGSTRTPAERESYLQDLHKKEVSLAKTLKSQKQLTNEQAKRNDYMRETRVNKDEFAGDSKGLREAQRRTEAFYGRRGKTAQASEAQRRRRSQDRLESMMRKSGMKRGSDGVWRKA